MAIVNGWLQGVTVCPSPNFGERPCADVSLMVVHAISLPPGQFGGTHIEDFFQNRLDVQADPYFESIATLRVSAHGLIKRDGTLIQCVSFDKRAWHAGQSMFNGREECNDFSIGIELEGCDEQPFSEAQYQQLASLTQQLQAFYPKIIKNNIVGHSDIAPGRKTDPGPLFDWPYFHSFL
ncbi:MAG: AmpD protein [Flavobacteriales bacterium]